MLRSHIHFIYFIRERFLLRGERTSNCCYKILKLREHAYIMYIYSFFFEHFVLTQIGLYILHYFCEKDIQIDGWYVQSTNFGREASQAEQLTGEHWEYPLWNLYSVWSKLLLSIFCFIILFFWINYFHGYLLL